MNKCLLNILLGITLISQTNIGKSNIAIKNVCVNGYEFIITHIIYNNDPEYGFAVPKGGLEVNQVYENTTSGVRPKQCKE